MDDGTVRLATRSSELARRQAEAVREALATRRRPVELVTVESRGDRVRDELIRRLGRTGAFVRALDERVLAGEVDAAVHSLKDMPTERPDDLLVAGVPERAAAGDLLVTPDGTGLDGLAPGAVVGTGSLRRRALLLRERDDLTVRPIRGNVDSRIEKLLAPTLQREHERRLAAAGEADDDADGADEEFERSPREWFEALAPIERAALERSVETEFDALVLAEAGLARLGLLETVPTEALAPDRIVPAAGQGAVAVTATPGPVADRIRERVDHPRTRVEATAERVVLAELGGGCVAPIGVYARLRGEYVHVTAVVAGLDGSETVAESRELPVERHAEAAAELAADLRGRGAAELVAAAREHAETADDAAAGEASDG
jgi:hydroxymethylbilane synthase